MRDVLNGVVLRLFSKHRIILARTLLIVDTAFDLDPAGNEKIHTFHCYSGPLIGPLCPQTYAISSLKMCLDQARMMLCAI